MEIVEAVRPLKMPYLVQQTIPIGIGIALTSAVREPLLGRLPSGFVARLGRMGMAFADATVGAVTCLAARFVVPEGFRERAFLAGAAAFAFAGYDALKALLGGVRATAKVSTVTVQVPPVVSSEPMVSSEPPVSTEPKTAPREGYY
ncbi:MAG: hypothetical protein QXP81_10865 [Nitrososphaerota archaeon]